MRRVDSTQSRRRNPVGPRLFTEAFFWLALARIILRAIPFPWLARLLKFQQGDGAAMDLAMQDRDFYQRAKHVRRALSIAARRAPWRNNCMARAVAGACMLRLRGMNSTLTVGVRNTIHSGELKAHAWLVAGGVLVTGGQSHRHYSPITTFASPPKPR